MSDDFWTRELRQVNREIQDDDRRRLDERWDRLSSGELSPDEEAELRVLAESSGEGREAWEAFRPLGPEFQARVVQTLKEEVREPSRTAEEPAAKLLPFRRRIVRLGGWGALAAAAAAIVVLLARPSAPLPGYALDLTGGSLTWRGATPEAATIAAFAPGDRLQVVLRPETRTSGELEARCYLLRDQEARRLDLRSETDAATGAVRLEGSIGRDLLPGRWTLWAVVGRRGNLPPPDDLRQLSAGAEVRGTQWAALPREIRIVAREVPP
jgi:hypothetical protein